MAWPHRRGCSTPMPGDDCGPECVHVYVTMHTVVCLTIDLTSQDLSRANSGRPCCERKTIIASYLSSTQARALLSVQSGSSGGGRSSASNTALATAVNPNSEIIQPAALLSFRPRRWLAVPLGCLFHCRQLSCG